MIHTRLYGINASSRNSTNGLNPELVQIHDNLKRNLMDIHRLNPNKNFAWQANDLIARNTGQAGPSVYTNPNRQVDLHLNILKHFHGDRKVSVAEAEANCRKLAEDARLHPVTRDIHLDWIKQLWLIPDFIKTRYIIGPEQTDKQIQNTLKAIDSMPAIPPQERANFKARFTADLILARAIILTENS